MDNFKCRGCGGIETTDFCDLGTCPPSNQYLSQHELCAVEHYYPLKTFVCNSCFLVQTQDFTKSEDLFTREYAYLSSTSATWVNHAKIYSDMISRRLHLDENSTITEIASNDGYLLCNFIANTKRAYGVEPTELAALIAQQRGVETVVDFFTSDLAHNLVKERGHSDLIICNNVLAHVPDINDFVAGLSILLDRSGTITLEFPHLMNLVSGNQYDTIYHEHFSYLSLLSLINICKQHKLLIYDVEEISTHGGSLRVYVQHAYGREKINKSVNGILEKERRVGLDCLEVYSSFQETVVSHKKDIQKFVIDKFETGKKIYGFGAAAKGSTLLNFCGFRNDYIKGVFDNASSKIGKYMPGSRIEILDMRESEKYDIDVALIFPWNIKNEIISHIRTSNQKCQIYTLIPQIEQLT